MEAGADEFLPDLVDSVPGIDSEDAARARGIFVRLLGIESLRTFSKGLKLQREGELWGLTAQSGLAPNIESK